MTTAHVLLIAVLLVIIAVELWGILQATSTIASLLQDELEDLKAIARRAGLRGR